MLSDNRIVVQKHEVTFQFIFSVGGSFHYFSLSKVCFKFTEGRKQSEASTQKICKIYAVCLSYRKLKKKKK